MQFVLQRGVEKWERERERERGNIGLREKERVTFFCYVCTFSNEQVCVREGGRFLPLCVTRRVQPAAYFLRGATPTCTCTRTNHPFESVQAVCATPERVCPARARGHVELTGRGEEGFLRNGKSWFWKQRVWHITNESRQPSLSFTTTPPPPKMHSGFFFLFLSMSLSLSLRYNLW